MRKHSKIIIVSLIVVLLLLQASVVLAVKEITYCSTKTDPTTIKVDKEIIKRFEEKYPDVDVKLTHLGVNTLLSDLAPRIRAGTAPDVILSYAAMTQSLMHQDLVLPVTEVWNELGDISEGMDSSFRDGEYYAVPLNIQSVVLYYRKDLFEKEGLEVPKTWDEWLEAARKLTKDTDGDGEIDQWGFGFTGAPPANLPEFTDFVWLNGGYLFDKNNQVNVNSDKAIEALKFLGKLVEYAPPGVSNTSYHDKAVEFAKGMTAMILHPGRIMTSIERYDTSLRDKIAIALPPRGDAKEPLLRRPTQNLVVMKSTEHPEIAKKFIEFYMSEDQYALKMSKAVPGHALPVRTSWLDREEYLNTGQIAKYKNIVKKSVEWAWEYGIDFHSEHPGVANPFIGQAMSHPVLKRQINEFLAGNVKAEEALNQVAEVWSEDIVNR